MNDIKIALPQPQAPWESRWLQGRLEHLHLRDIDGDQQIEGGNGEAHVDRIAGGEVALRRLVGTNNGPVSLDRLQELAPRLSPGEKFDRAVSAGPKGRINANLRKAETWVRGLAAKTQGVLNALQDLKASEDKASLAQELRRTAPALAAQFADPTGAQRELANSERELFAQIVGLSQASKSLMNHSEFAHLSLEDVRGFRDHLRAVSNVLRHLESNEWQGDNLRSVDGANSALSELADEVAPFFGVDFPAYQFRTVPGESGTTRVSLRPPEP